MNYAIIRFRFVQLWKTVREIPPIYMVLVLILLALGSIFLFGAMKSCEGSLVVSSITLLLIYLLHHRRKDYRFIFLIELHPWRVFSIEYILLSLPVIGIAIYHNHFSALFLTLIGCLFISFKKRRIHRLKQSFHVPRFIPFAAFEIRSGVRRYGWTLVVLYVIMLAGLFVPYVSLVCIWIITVLITEFYHSSESLAILCADELSGGAFLSKKLRLNMTLYVVFLLPLLMLYSIIYSDHIWLALYVLMYGTIFIGLLIFTKYAHYDPGKEIRAGQVGVGLSMFGMLLPPVFLLMVALLLKNYWAARRNLTRYLYAYN